MIIGRAVLGGIGGDHRFGLGGHVDRARRAGAITCWCRQRRRGWSRRFCTGLCRWRRAGWTRCLTNGAVHHASGHLRHEPPAGLWRYFHGRGSRPYSRLCARSLALGIAFGGLLKRQVSLRLLAPNRYEPSPFGQFDRTCQLRERSACAIGENDMTCRLQCIHGPLSHFSSTVPQTKLPSRVVGVVR